MLDEWAAEFNIPFPALLALKLRIGIRTSEVTPAVKLDDPVGSEARQQSLVRLAAAERGVWLTRNNVGALMDVNNRVVRFGLANESKEQNAALKSGDLIGMESVLITQQHVGTIMGRFLSVEMKEAGWSYTGTEHEVGQLNWINLVNSKGGKAFFANGPEQFNQLIR